MKDEIEIKLETLWCRLLNIESVDKDTNFFDEGGNSLHISIMSDTLKDEFGISITPETFYSCSVFGELLEEVKRKINEQ